MASSARLTRSGPPGKERGGGAADDGDLGEVGGLVDGDGVDVGGLAGVLLAETAGSLVG